MVVAGGVPRSPAVSGAQSISTGPEQGHQVSSWPSDVSSPQAGVAEHRH